MLQRINSGFICRCNPRQLAYPKNQSRNFIIIILYLYYNYIINFVNYSSLLSHMMQMVLKHKTIIKSLTINEKLKWSMFSI